MRRRPAVGPDQLDVGEARRDVDALLTRLRRVAVELALLTDEIVEEADRLVGVAVVA